MIGRVFLAIVVAWALASAASANSSYSAYSSYSPYSSNSPYSLYSSYSSYSRQNPSLTFRSVANYVEIDAVVTDANGAPVSDLKSSDFDVVEDGKPQSLSVCAFVSLPITPAPPRPAKDAPKSVGARAPQPDVVTNTKTLDGRVYMVVLDGYHVNARRAAFVRRDATNFVERYVGPDDLAAVVQIGNPEAGQEFTNNRQLLAESIAKFNGAALPSITANLVESYSEHGIPADKDALVREFMTRQSLDSVRRLAESMAALRGRRKAVLFFSEGVEIDTNERPRPAPAAADIDMPPMTDPRGILEAEKDMIAAATRANVSLYTIDPRGLSKGSEDMIGISIPFGAMEIPTDPRDLQVKYAVDMILTAEVRRGQDTLQMFADQTGGLAAVNQNDMDAAFARIVEDNSNYYVLGYASPDPKHDGRFHRISIKVKRPGLRVRTLNGYYAPEDKPSPKTKVPADPVVDGLVSPLPLGGLGMRAHAGVLKGLAKKSTVHLTIEFTGADVALKPSGGLFTNDIEVEYLAVDMKGAKQANAREVAHLQLRPETRASFAQLGVRYITEFELPPGRYQLRVAARERLGGKTGSVFCDVDVPDVTAKPLVVSDLLVTTATAAKTATPHNVSSIGALLPAPTTAVREFSAGETLTVASAIYDNDPQSGDVTLTASVTNIAGAAVLTRTDHRPAADLAPAKGGFNWVVTLPLTGLAPGRYVLTVDAKSTLSKEPAGRSIEIVVR